MVAIHTRQIRQAPKLTQQAVRIPRGSQSDQQSQSSSSGLLTHVQRILIEHKNTKYLEMNSNKIFHQKYLATMPCLFIILENRISSIKNSQVSVIHTFKHPYIFVYVFKQGLFFALLGSII